MSAILRHRHPNRFTVLPNDAIRNPALSFRAVGVLAHLLSLPDGAKVDSATLAATHKEGRDAVRAAYKELEAHGYYRREIVRLADGTLRTEVVVSSTPMNGEGPGRTGDGKSGAGPEPGNPASAGPAPVDPAPDRPTPVDQAAREEPTTQELIPPQPPRPAGGQGHRETTLDPVTSPGWRRSRAAGTNPRAEAERAEAARIEADAAARQAELERRVEERRAADEAAEQEAQRLEAEGLALSAALDAPTLADIVRLVTASMAGPLARSPLAVARAVLSWCRAAAAHHPGPLADAIAAGLAAELGAGEGTTSAPLALPPAPAGTPSLRRRITDLRAAAGAA